MKNRQHECLVEALGEVSGIERFQPRGASFELLRVSATHVSLLPWRYGTNRAASRTKVRMRPSGLRRDLLSGPRENPNQTSIEQAELSEAEIEAQMAEHDAVWDQLRRLARVVTIAYASNPQGLFDLGWGDVELLDDKGAVRWLHWEPLAMSGVSTANNDGASPHLEVARVANVERSAGPRFDDADEHNDTLPMRVRPSTGEPQHERPTSVVGIDDGDGPVVGEPR